MISKQMVTKQGEVSGNKTVLETTLGEPSLEEGALHIGCHLSSSKGFLAMGKQALAIGANTFQFFTRNPRGSKAKELDVKDAQALMTFLREHHFAQILAHAPYTLNPAGSRLEVREFAQSTMEDDLRRMEYLPGNLYNFHPGSHVGQGSQEGIRLITQLLNRVMQPGQHTTVLLETMAGKGTEVGRNFQELEQILEGAVYPEHLGICLDTCHIFDGGYDIVNQLEEVIDQFQQTIGLEKLRAIHLNDTMNTLGSHKDRHQKIGEGNIGLEAMVRIINHPAFQDLPFYLETPNELDGYQREIALLRGHYHPKKVEA